MAPLNPTPEYTAAQNALVSLHREIRNHPKYKHFTSEINAASDACQGDVITTLRTAQADFVQEQFGQRLKEARAAFLAAGGAPDEMMLRMT